MQREGKALPQASLPFHRATPSMTHMALVELEKAGILKFVISQVRMDGTLLVVHSFPTLQSVAFTLYIKLSLLFM